MKGYKAFEPGLICKGKRYAENTVFEESEAIVCKSGMHFCENPFDVLDYYPLVNDKGEFSDFAEVEAVAETKTDDKKKYCTTKLKVGAKMSFAGFVKACVDFAYEKTIKDMPSSKVCALHSAKIGSSGDYAQIGSSGHYAQIGSSGDSAQIGSSGHCAQIGSSGHYAKIGSSGDSAKINSTGEDSVVCCAGANSIAKAKVGSWITLSEWEYSKEKGRDVPVCVKTEHVDGDKIKADIWYKLCNGEFVELIE